MFEKFFPRQDLGVLAMSNATIVSRGTFGLFGRILNGQKRISQINFSNTNFFRFSTPGGPYYTEYGMAFPHHLLHPEDKDEENYEELKL